jgi:hypothetical protein
MIENLFIGLFLLQRGKTVPEGLATVEDIKTYRQLASHTVCKLDRYTCIVCFHHFQFFFFFSYVAGFKITVDLIA